MDGTFGDIFPLSRFSGFAPGTQSFGVRLLPGSLTGIFAALVEGASGTSTFLLFLPEGVGTVAFSDPAGLTRVSLGGPGRLDDVVTGVAPVPLPPSGVALVLALGGLLALRRRAA